MQAMLTTLQTELGRKMDAAQAATDLKLDNLMGLHDGLSGELNPWKPSSTRRLPRSTRPWGSYGH
eukprot:7722410-Pyramimonas_sp.AAC.1